MHISSREQQSSAVQPERSRERDVDPPVVGIGTSAGGLEVLATCLSPDGACIVARQHLAPGPESEPAYTIGDGRGIDLLQMGAEGWTDGVLETHERGADP
jgi:hypothetical protein